MKVCKRILTFLILLFSLMFIAGCTDNQAKANESELLTTHSEFISTLRDRVSALETECFYLAEENTQLKEQIKAADFKASDDYIRWQNQLVFRQKFLQALDYNFTYWHEDYLDLKQDYEKTLRALDKAEKDFEEFYQDYETLKLEVERLKQEIIALQEGGK